MPVYKMPVRLTYGTGSTRGTNTFHFRTTGAAVDQVQIDALVNLVSQFYLAVAGLWGSDSRAIFDGALTEVGTATPTAGVASVPFNRQGTASGVTPGPAGVGACITWRSTLATRSGRGRTFIVPLHQRVRVQRHPGRRRAHHAAERCHGDGQQQQEPGQRSDRRVGRHTASAPRRRGCHGHGQGGVALESAWLIGDVRGSWKGHSYARG